MVLYQTINIMPCLTETQKQHSWVTGSRGVTVVLNRIFNVYHYEDQEDETSVPTEKHLTTCYKCNTGSIQLLTLFV